MKTAKNLFLWTGILLLIIFGMRIFGMFENIITTDKAFLYLLISGILLTMTGFHLEARTIETKSRLQERNKQSQKRYSLYAILSCFGIIVLLMSSCSPKSDNRPRYKVYANNARDYRVKLVDSPAKQMVTMRMGFMVGDTVLCNNKLVVVLP